MKATATETSYVMDMRRRRADGIAHLTMDKIKDFIDPRDREHVYYALLDLFLDQGFDFVTDEMREKAGLEPRGKLGWTERELHVLESARILALLEPYSLSFPIAKESPTVSDVGRK